MNNYYKKYLKYKTKYLELLKSAELRRKKEEEKAAQKRRQRKKTIRVAKLAALRREKEAKQALEKKEEKRLAQIAKRAVAKKQQIRNMSNKSVNIIDKQRKQWVEYFNNQFIESEREKLSDEEVEEKIITGFGIELETNIFMIFKDFPEHDNTYTLLEHDDCGKYEDGFKSKNTNKSLFPIPNSYNPIFLSTCDKSTHNFDILKPLNIEYLDKKSTSVNITSLENEKMKVLLKERLEDPKIKYLLNTVSNEINTEWISKVFRTHDNVNLIKALNEIITKYYKKTYNADKYEIDKQSYKNILCSINRFIMNNFMINLLTSNSTPVILDYKKIKKGKIKDIKTVGLLYKFKNNKFILAGTKNTEELTNNNFYNSLVSYIFKNSKKIWPQITLEVSNSKYSYFGYTMCQLYNNNNVKIEEIHIKFYEWWMKNNNVEVINEMLKKNSDNHMRVGNHKKEPFRYFILLSFLFCVNTTKRDNYLKAFYKLWPKTLRFSQNFIKHPQTEQDEQDEIIFEELKILYYEFINFMFEEFTMEPKKSGRPLDRTKWAFWVLKKVKNGAWYPTKSKIEGHWYLKDSGNMRTDGGNWHDDIRFPFIFHNEDFDLEEYNIKGLYKGDYEEDYFMELLANTTGFSHTIKSKLYTERYNKHMYILKNARKFIYWIKYKILNEVDDTNIGTTNIVEIRSFKEMVKTDVCELNKNVQQKIDEKVK